MENMETCGQNMETCGKTYGKTMDNMENIWKNADTIWKNMKKHIEHLSSLAPQSPSNITGPPVINVLSVGRG